MQLRRLAYSTVIALAITGFVGGVYGDDIAHWTSQKIEQARDPYDHLSAKGIVTANLTLYADEDGKIPTGTLQRGTVIDVTASRESSDKFVYRIIKDGRESYVLASDEELRYFDSDFYHLGSNYNNVFELLDYLNNQGAPFAAQTKVDLIDDVDTLIGIYYSEGTPNYYIVERVGRIGYAKDVMPFLESVYYETLKPTGTSRPDRVADAIVSSAKDSEDKEIATRFFDSIVRNDSMDCGFRDAAAYRIGIIRGDDFYFDTYLPNLYGDPDDTCINFHIKGAKKPQKN